MAENNSLAVIIPAYNEALSIGAVVAAIKDLRCADQILVVDDGSTDQTGERASAAGACVIRHDVKLGYGAALRTGVLHTTATFVLAMDGDGQHRPEDAIRLWDCRDGADLVAGWRVKVIHSPAWRMPGKWLLSWLAQYLTRRSIPDLNCGLRLFRRDVLVKYLHLCPPGYSFSTTTTLTFLSRGRKVTFVPIEVNPRVGRSAVSISTGLETAVLILRIVSLFEPLRVFVPISAVLIGLGGIWAMPFAILGRGVSVGAMLAITTGVLLFGIGLLCDQISQMRLERLE